MNIIVIYMYYLIEWIIYIVLINEMCGIDSIEFIENKF